ncbi:shikimate dehydrogenase family protein [Leifsonia sp. AG29]|uniref:shikimate dehydrogenase family protein n=1 Tax=Leifsonia sp. AG29 TaxID=2598860 RepID=UPI00131D3B80|nr:shikimate dehydrogenase [Leifsonia sp. AG29]
MIDQGRMGFVGVDTAHSSIQKVFPLWADHLGLPSRELRGFDIPLGAPDAVYREVVERIRDDEGQAGALVTTHKMRVFEAAGDLFDEVDDFARACGEVSSIAKRSGRLVGAAKDPITVGLSLDDVVPSTYFADTGAELVCLGAGGSGVALSWHLAHRQDTPSKVTLVGRTRSSLDHARAIHERGGIDTSRFVYHPLDEGDPLSDATAVVGAAGEGAVIVNATGLGKDRPGSPLADDVVFPLRARVWEFNYRGSLEFLYQARAQEQHRELTVVDGWVYFIHGWSQVVADVFDIPMPPSTVAELAEIASTVR